jgi:hypothetical protein
MTEVTRLPGKDLVWLQLDCFAIMLRSRQGETKEYMTVIPPVESMVQNLNWDARVIIFGFIIENLECCTTGRLIFFSKSISRCLEFYFGERGHCR